VKSRILRGRRALKEILTPLVTERRVPGRSYSSVRIASEMRPDFAPVSFSGRKTGERVRSSLRRGAAGEGQP
jgi:hypothetical protein